MGLKERPRRRWIVVIADVCIKAAALLLRRQYSWWDCTSKLVTFAAPRRCRARRRAALLRAIPTQTQGHPQPHRSCAFTTSVA